MRIGRIAQTGFQIAATVWLGASTLGCDEDKDSETVSVAQHLTVQQNRILGFEDPVQDWSADNQSTIGASTVATEGTTALSVEPTGYTQLVSALFDAPGSSKEEASFDLQLPQSLDWGDARLVMTIPSQGHHWRDLGGTDLSHLSSGTFHSLKFSVPEDIRSALESDAADVTVRIVLNAPTGVGEFLVDNLVVSDDTTGGGAEEVTTAPKSISVSYPRGIPISAVLASGTEKLTIDDRSTLGRPGGLNVLSSVGPAKTEFGAGVTAYADVFSMGSVDFLRSQSHVTGNVTTEGTIVQQDNVTIDGEARVGVEVASASINWAVDWPSEEGSDVSRPPDSPNLALEPGTYDSIEVFPRASVSFTAGTYFIRSLVAEPEAELRVDTSLGPVIIYVMDTLRLNVGLNRTAGPRGQVLFGYLGHQAPIFREALVASVVAPNSTIELRRPNSGLPFEGSFFGKAVHVFSDATVLHLPMQWLEGSMQRCADSVPIPADDGSMTAAERKVAYQRALAEICSMPGADPCEQEIAARIEVDYTDIAFSLLGEVVTPAEYLSVVLDRARKEHEAQLQPATAQAICSDGDDDLDLVPNSVDECPNTPPLTATYDNGCTDPNLPEAPSAEDTRNALSSTNLMFDQRCSGAQMAGRGSAGGFYLSDLPEKGTFMLVHRGPPQPPGCKLWYFIEVREFAPVQRTYRVAFSEDEATTDLLFRAGTVPPSHIQFNPKPGDPGTRGYLGSVRSADYRVRIMNSGGMRSGWSDWKRTTINDCRTLGFHCSN